MSEVFLKLLNMSISAGFLVLAVCVLRFLLKKAPKWAVCILWAIVGLRLIVPFGVTSSLSLIPSAETVRAGAVPDSPPVIDSGFAFVNSAVNPVISGFYEGKSAAEAPVSETPPGTSSSVGVSHTPARGADPVLIAAIVWASGACAMLVYMLVSRLRLEKRTSARLETEKGVFVCDALPSPFILGVFRPRIFLPSGLSEADRAHVLGHERAHIKRGDHIWKPLGFMLLSLHWFNPLMWLAYALLCRDIELACDEKVISRMDNDARAAYSETILCCSKRSRLITACPLAFGETAPKQRVRKVLDYKKPAFWLIILAVLAAIVCAVCFLTNPDRGASDKVKCVKLDPVMMTETAIEIKKADEAFLEELITGPGWQEGETPLFGAYGFTADKKTVRYDPAGHILWDPESGTFKTVSYGDWARLNGMLSLETAIPFELENAKGFSNDHNVRVGAAGMSFTSHNTVTAVFDVVGDEYFQYGEFCALYKKVGGDWEKVPVRTDVDFAFSCVGYGLFAHSFATHAYSLDMFGDLEAGEYRLYLNGSKPTDYWIDFTLKAPAKAYFPGAAAHSEHAGVDIGVSLAEEYDRYMLFGLVWNNNTDGDIEADGSFTLSHFTDDGYTELFFDEVPEERYTVPAGESRYVPYQVYGYYKLEPGRYRLYPGRTGEYWIDFSVDTQEERLNKLRAGHGEFFGLGGKKLFIYVMNERYYVTDEYFDVPEDGDCPEMAKRISSRGVCAADMRLVLSQYMSDGYHYDKPVDVIPVVDIVSSTAFLPEFICARAYTALFGTFGYEGAEAEERLEELREKAPEYFGLDTSNGLNVYVWQMARGSFSFCLKPGGEHKWEELLSAYGVGSADMRLILSTYDIPDEDITVIPYHNPISSYYYRIDSYYVPGVRKMLGLSPDE